MTATNRETARDGLTTILTTALVGTGKPAQAVYGYAIGDLGGQSPVVRIMSAGTDRSEATYDTDFYTTFFFTVECWVLKVETSSSWTEADAEDRLDLLEKTIADTLTANYANGSAWDRISFDGRSNVVDGSLLGGENYTVEIIPIRAEKDDTG